LDVGNDVLHVNRSINSVLSSSISFSVFEKKEVDFFFPLARQICPTRQKNVKRKKRKNFGLTIGSALHQLEQGDERQAGEEPEPRPPARPLHFRVCVSFPVEGFLLPKKIPQF
jgi:hypothetical protein